jgi:2-polyprenyl-3-methyl-5-hydroxy-6-metoxy-1,4-benzoquinol methylase
MPEVESQNPFDVMLESYLAWAEPVTSGFARSALARADLRPASRVFDVACGAGARALPAAQDGHEVLGIDLAPKMAALPHVEQTGGNFVAVFSISGLAGDWGWPAYNATKSPTP